MGIVIIIINVLGLLICMCRALEAADNNSLAGVLLYIFLIYVIAVGLSINIANYF